ncbi:MAG: hypothetical protein CM15mP120_05910 [Pseudomonadota bacterium]|nr:MAG: hypothetical protein CM15mP120_05910 [Pseudomonadota bacterium]
MFTVYHPEHGKALAQGGRYDGVGEVFGRARSATGFDMNLKQLLASGVGQSDVIFAPWQQHSEQRAALQQVVESLREGGSRVVMGLSAGETAPQQCERHEPGGWTMAGGEPLAVNCGEASEKRDRLRIGQDHGT